MKRWKSGTVGWFALTAFVLAWDVGISKCGGETLSSAFWRATRNPVARWPVTFAWLITTGHLFGLIPEQFDPYKIVVRLSD